MSEKTTSVTKIGFLIDLHGRGNNPISRLGNYPEAILKKVQYIIDNNDIIIGCGDIFNTYIVSIQFINKLLMILTKAESNGKKILLIFGNHDIIGRNYSSYLQTALGTLTIGRDWLLTNPRVINNVGLYSLMFNSQGKPIIYHPEKVENINIPLKILVGHAYFEHPEYNDKWNIDTEYLSNLDFDYCILGHDHQQYEISSIEKDDGSYCLLLRSGTISRATIDEKDLEIKYPQIRVFYNEKGKITKHETSYEGVPYEAAELVFKLEDTTGKDLIQHKKNIDRMLELLQIENHKKDEKLSVNKILKEIKCPVKYQNIIQEVLHG